MELLHSASPAAYAYFDRIEAVGQNQADIMFDTAAANARVRLPAVIARRPAEPDMRFGRAPARPSVDWGDLTITTFSLVLAAAMSGAIAFSFPTNSYAAAISISAIVGCGVASVWPNRAVETELEG
ncbi:MAG: hypothetical protein E6Q40_09025 [Cupriavidus sp.]|nr:MAG: hypothetical protein E6Q40_09025 [Cupriavidus sp.]